MAITLHQINGGTVPPVADARLYDFLGGAATGIVKGCEVTSIGGNQLQVSGGWGLVYGRVFTVTQTTLSAAVSQSGDVTGRLIIEIDTTSTTPISFVTQAESPLPDLVQQDINAEGTIYELPLATYTVNEIAISELENVAPVASSGVIALYTHTKSGTVHTLTGTGSNIKFISTGAFEDGDTFVVNGELCSAITQSGQALSGGAFASGVVVSCFRYGDQLNFKSSSAGNVNIKIVGGTTQPTKPANNTLWLNTAVPITDYQFTNIAPTTRSSGAALTGGELYIMTSRESNGSFSLGDNMQINPAAAYQLIGGVWTLVGGQTFTGGEWREWAVYFANGVATAQVTNTGARVGTMSVSPILNNNEVRSSLLYVDLTNIKTLKITLAGWNCANTYCRIRAGAWSEVPTTANQFSSTYLLADESWVGTASGTAGANRKCEIDVAEISGYAYVGVCMRFSSSNSGYVSASVSEVIGLA